MIEEGRHSSRWAVSSLLVVASIATVAWVHNGASEFTRASSDVNFHSLFAEHLRSAKYIDLTHAFSPEVAVWPGFGPSTFIPGKAGQTIQDLATKGDTWNYLTHGFQTSAYSLTTDQLGTQLDPPAHWNEMGATISDLPPTFSVRPLVVVDISAEVATNASYHAAPADVLRWEKQHGRVPAGSAVFFRSDWSKKWEVYGKHGLPDEFPGVALDTLKLLHVQRGILVHGHEPLDCDMTPSLEGEAWLMHNNFAQAEGLTNLHLVPSTGCLLSIGFAKPQGGTGGYARYVAICPGGSAAGGVTIDQEPGAPLKTQVAPLRRSAKGVLEPLPGSPPTRYCEGAEAKNALGCSGGKPVWLEPGVEMPPPAHGK